MVQAFAGLGFEATPLGDALGILDTEARAGHRRAGRVAGGGAGYVGIVGDRCNALRLKGAAR
jgi:hypothetical protein